MTSLSLADIRALHLSAATDGQRTLSRRTTSILCVVLVHIVLLYVFWLRPISPQLRQVRTPLETILLLSPLDLSRATLPENEKENQNEDGIGRPQTIAPVTITIPPPKLPTQQDLDEEMGSGLGRALACTAGQFEYLAESARRACERYLVPWSLNREEVLARQFKPTDPNTVPLNLGGAETNRRMYETYDPCVGSTGPTVSACRTLHPGR